MPQRTCPKCHAQQARRIKQQGFLQQTVLRRFGYYPWECRFCKETFLIKDRGLTGRRGGPDRHDNARGQVEVSVGAEQAVD